MGSKSGSLSADWVKMVWKLGMSWVLVLKLEVPWVLKIQKTEAR